MRCLNQRILIFSISLICFFIAQTAKAALVDDLKDGQHVLLMRHADAPGYGDPAGYDIGQCPTQRNLGDYGKNKPRPLALG